MLNRFTGFLIWMALALAACSPVGPTPEENAQRQDFDKYMETHLGTAAASSTYISGNTLRNFSNNHTRIIYFSPDGRAVAWHSGNNYPVHARWTIKAGWYDQPHICFTDAKGTRSNSFIFPSNGQYPAPLIDNGAWRCTWIKYDLHDLRERVEGDPFNLATLSTFPTRITNIERDFSWVNARVPAPARLTYLHVPPDAVPR